MLVLWIWLYIRTHVLVCPVLPPCSFKEPLFININPCFEPYPPTSLQRHANAFDLLTKLRLPAYLASTTVCATQCAPTNGISLRYHAEPWGLVHFSSRVCDRFVVRPGTSTPTPPPRPRVVLPKAPSRPDFKRSRTRTVPNRDRRDRRRLLDRLPGPC